MQQPQHALLAPNSTAMSPKRIMSLGLVGLVHVGLIYALLTGLAQNIINKIPPVLEATIVEPATPETKEMVIPKPQLETPPAPDTIQPPDIVIDTNSEAPPVQVAPQLPSTPPITASASSVNSTHTTPPYPEQARRMNVSGTVTLHLNITAQGTVSNAAVTSSSGNAELDSNAVTWVVRHWKYKPALAAGTPVASEADANVVYDLKKAR